MNENQVGSKIVITGTPEPGQTVILVQTYPKDDGVDDYDEALAWHSSLVNAIGKLLLEKGICLEDIKTGEHLLTKEESGLE